VNTVLQLTDDFVEEPFVATQLSDKERWPRRRQQFEVQVATIGHVVAVPCVRVAGIGSFSRFWGETASLHRRVTWEGRSDLTPLTWNHQCLSRHQMRNPVEPPRCWTLVVHLAVCGSATGALVRPGVPVVLQIPQRQGLAYNNLDGHPRETEPERLAMPSRRLHSLPR